MKHPLAVAAVALAAAAVTIAPAPAEAREVSTPPAMSRVSAPVVEVGGVSLGGLPDGLGEHSVFESEDEDVAITSGVWESPVDEGYAVDLSVTVLRSGQFTTPVVFRDWMIQWQERPAEEAVYRRISINGQPAWLAKDQVLLLVRPGLAVSITLDADRFDPAALRPMARSVQEVPGVSS